MSQRIQNLLRALLSVALLGFVLRQADLRHAAATLLQADPVPLLLAFGLYQIGVGIRAFRWQTLLASLGIEAPLRRLWSLYLIGTFYSQVLPSGIGGDVVRMVELSAESGRATAVVSSTVVDRFTGLFVLFLIALGALPFSFRLVPVELATAIVVVTAGTVVGTMLLLYRPLLRWLRRAVPFVGWIVDRPQVRAMYETLHRYTAAALLRACAASLAFNVLLIAGVYLLALALGIRISPWYFLLFVPIVSFSLVLPISISGLGVREGTFVFLFTQAGVAAPQALALSFAYYAVTLATGLIGGAVHALQGALGLRSGREDATRES